MIFIDVITYADYTLKPSQFQNIQRGGDNISNNFDTNAIAGVKLIKKLIHSAFGVPGSIFLGENSFFEYFLLGLLFLKTTRKLRTTTPNHNSKTCEKFNISFGNLNNFYYLRVWLMGEMGCPSFPNGWYLMGVDARVFHGLIFQNK